MQTYSGLINFKKQIVQDYFYKMKTFSRKSQRYGGERIEGLVLQEPKRKKTILLFTCAVL